MGEMCVLRRSVAGSHVRIDYTLCRQGEDVVVLVAGGAAHAGCVVVAQPVAGLSGRKRAGSSLITVDAHRDEQVTRQLAEAACDASGRRVVAVGGVHFEGFTPALLEEVRALDQQAVAQVGGWVEALFSDRGGGGEEV